MGLIAIQRSRQGVRHAACGSNTDTWRREIPARRRSW